MALGAGVGVASLAAADPTATPSPGQSTASPSKDAKDPAGRPGPGGKHDQRDGELAKKLAGKLGVTEAKVTEAIKAIRADNKGADKPPPGERPDPQARQAEMAKALAGKLGVSEDKVKAAFEEIRTEQQADHQQAFKTKLDGAVKAGTLTQAEADAVLKAAEMGVIGMGGPGPR